MKENQKTLQQEIAINGKGLHTGLNVKLTIKPAPENHGIKFRRLDIENQPIVKALVENVVDTSRGTAIEENGARIYTVEHILSALYSKGIDNAVIELNAQEVPILDGSAKIYIDKINETGIIEQKAEKQYFVLKEKIRYFDEKNNIEILALPEDELRVNVLISHDSEVLSNQFASLNSLSDYDKEIAECRTFVFLKDLEPLLKQNLIKGGDLNNAIVIIGKEISQEELNKLADLFNQPHVKVKPQGILNNVDLSFENEPARHKLLDLLGDIALVGMPIKARIIATRPGHYSNVEFAKLIRQKIKRTKSSAPDVDINAKPLFDIEGIKRLLPHRPPFLLIDKVLEADDESVIAIKNVTMNEQFFVGHFPNMPVMPGVLIVEAMAQAGGILVLKGVPDPENYSTLFMKLDNIKFRNPVVPGDTLVFKMELITPIRRGIANMSGQAFVGDKLVTEGEFMAQISKTK
ncbi:MAG: bifunctional UDP-3-O-[3-hydroxymyristoyl] N-acetylglucosamine deacetylase/3-hydroxyacyl-ACP dehydratase [Bacteroidetes bacterium]|jgi:UDP-3-O-[3-hydroxymyristoyl] N-acetylglucosamine deacetylase / 3-hydroxyacyl-[acyl-carrier-protein] dehydratase|nr:bifunctional UDP-3-O-[3-hydroxymyristoyl] N-acetylglucosamine deacetylase/3-hydroxyacyl-ACP dehydratase [Bacteroidota bacterium]MBT6686055.1 bifunctional UDP-3-O-[3-hydroxymyristoyl] N-acetylglucosamine deacetylase/3-hydroxyacyl-ACP dehydratase [Bacteroidota bacterium]MBT7142725.1 bifunctional UDP-3-O-[3-hydroxymyristoyl] N-acetylglucosamine deacetylase/3-hydroxyacyl-ACP dehydratase [Bacteroidota bacterium]MBT7491334.1 bifunctional UDP-3-O-[3-hydroxymyristoyl] N-acetylglucosamine deacetylase/